MVQHICCVGSSFAAGPGIEPIAHVGAGRSLANYAQTTADLLAAATSSSTPRSRPRVTDVSVSGATLGNIVDERQKPIRPPPQSETTRPQGVAPAPGQLGSDGLFAPQVTGVPPDADVILLTAGGNDVGYLSMAMRDAMAAGSWFGWMLSCILAALAPRPALQYDDEAGLTKRLAKAIDALHARAPQAKIVLVEYLALFPLSGSSQADDDAVEQAVAATGMRKELVQKYAEIAHMLTRAYAAVADDDARRSWCSIVAIDEESRRHHALGSTDSWVDGFSLSDLLQTRGSGKIPLHPNKKGMDAVAHRVVAHLQKLAVTGERMR